jgi:riboflavin kinase/FMN adenylyltransferase
MIAGARVARLDTVAVTFDPLPETLLHPEASCPSLSTVEERAELLREYGVDDVHVVPFTEHVAAQSAEEFLDDLRQAYEMRQIYVGADFALGHERATTIQGLREIGERDGISVITVPLMSQGGRKVSSSWIREALAAGDVELARYLLGRPYAIRGIVESGAQRGRLLGFPTANVAPPPGRALPADGVYYVEVQVLQAPDGTSGDDADGQGGGVRQGVVNLGGRPTFDETDRLLETHVLDFQGDLYGAYLSVAFIAQLRGTRKFSGVDELREQIERDVAMAREIAAR